MLVRGLRAGDARHLERGRVPQDSDHRQAQLAAGLRIADRDRDRIEDTVLEVKPLSWKSGSTAKLKLSLRGATVASTTARPRWAASACQTCSADSLAARDRAEAEGRVFEERPGRGRVRRSFSAGRPVPSWRAFTESTDWLPTAVKSAGSMPGACRSAACMFVIGAVAEVPARTWKPPPNSSMFAERFLERAGRSRAGDEREDDEREHRERRARPEARPQRVRDRHLRTPERACRSARGRCRLPRRMMSAL